MSQELKPCPFCGGKPRLALEEHDFDGCEVFCTECSAHSGHYTDKTGKLAIDAWNRRAIPSGYALVPVEATARMLLDGSEWTESAVMAAGCYAAMVAAAQQGGERGAG